MGGGYDENSQTYKSNNILILWKLPIDFWYDLAKIYDNAKYTINIKYNM